MVRSMTTKVNPSVFKWLRESSGWSVEDVSRRLRTSEEVVRSIESGRRDPTLRQLRELSGAYKRPLAAFFLSEPKQEKPKPKDYRMTPHKTGVFEKKTLMILRMARTLQEIGGELSRNIDRDMKPVIERVDISSDPSRIAGIYREEFDLTEEKQIDFKTTREMFNYLRDRLENINILVFQESIPVDDARGFTLSDDFPNVIVLSSQDSIEARIFSLLHEFGHILLGESVVDSPDPTGKVKNDIESWCNRFASHFLLPESLARSIFEMHRSDLTETSMLKKLSRKYKVSKGMLLFNMLSLDYISRMEYEEIIERYKPERHKEIGKENEETEVSASRSGGIPADIRCLSRLGNKFVSMVADNYELDKITYEDALNYLSIKSRNFDKVFAKAGK